MPMENSGYYVTCIARLRFLPFSEDLSKEPNSCCQNFYDNNMHILSYACMFFQTLLVYKPQTLRVNEFQICFFDDGAVWCKKRSFKFS